MSADAPTALAGELLAPRPVHEPAKRLPVVPGESRGDYGSLRTGILEVAPRTAKLRAVRLVGYVRVSRVGGRDPEVATSAPTQRERIAAQAVAHGHDLVEVGRASCRERV